MSPRNNKGAFEVFDITVLDDNGNKVKNGRGWASAFTGPQEPTNYTSFPEGFSISKTFRYVFFALAVTAISAATAVYFGFPLIHPFILLFLVFFPLSFLLVISSYFSNRIGFYFLLTYAAAFGLLQLGPFLGLVLALPNGPFIIYAALTILVAEVAVAFLYTWYKAEYSKADIGMFGLFLSTALAGFSILSILFFCLPATPVSLFIHSSLAVLLYSTYLVYDLYLVKTQQFSNSVIAAAHLYIDIMALFINIIILFISLSSKNENNRETASQLIWNFITTRGLPLLFIVGVILTAGYLESWYFEKSKKESSHNNINEELEKLPANKLDDNHQQPTTGPWSYVPWFIYNYLYPKQDDSVDVDIEYQNKYD